MKKGSFIAWSQVPTEALLLPQTETGKWGKHFKGTVPIFLRKTALDSKTGTWLWDLHLKGAEKESTVTNFQRKLFKKKRGELPLSLCIKEFFFFKKKKKKKNSQNTNYHQFLRRIVCKITQEDLPFVNTSFPQVSCSCSAHRGTF